MKRIASYLGIAAALLFAVSFYSPGWQTRLDAVVRLSQMRIQGRQKLLRKYVDRELQLQDENCIDVSLPEDMVMYKYVNDSLFSWENRFPTADDGVSAEPFLFRLYPGSSWYGSHPLAYIQEGKWQYVNLGGKWFLVSRFHAQNGHISIISGIRLEMRLPRGFRHTSLMDNPHGAVRGIDGEALFSIDASEDGYSGEGNAGARWMALLAAAAALVLMHLSSRTPRSLALSAAGLTAVRIAAIFLAPEATFHRSIFSPAIYADNLLAQSLADLLLNNAYVALMAWMLHSMRRKLSLKAMATGKMKLYAALAWTLATALAIYINHCYKSLILNSGIVLEPARIHDFSIYSVLCYLSLATLVLVFLLMLQTALRLSSGHRKINLFSWKGLTVCAALTACYFVAAGSSLGLKKEYDRNRISTSKMAMRRDIRLELYLRMMERGIAQDRFIGTLLGIDGGKELISNRLAERYFYNGLLSIYDVSITICGNHDLISDSPESEPLPCFIYFNDLIQSQGAPVDRSTNFTFIDGGGGNPSYLGAFTYYDGHGGDVLRMYLEFKMKHHSRPPYLPQSYSYAVYSGGRLSNAEGEFGYSTVIPQGYRRGYSMVSKDGYLHFINVLSQDEATIISRPYKPILPVVVSFSYLFIFFGLFISLCTIGHGRGRLLSLPRHSIKRKIILITSGTMMVALFSMGAAALAYNIRERKLSDKIRIDDNISKVQNALSGYLPHPVGHPSGQDGDFAARLDEVASIVGTDICIYDISGRLAYASGKPGSDRQSVKYRMDSRAFHEIVHLNAMRSIREEISPEGKTRTVYAPLTDAGGEMVGIVNMHYSGDATPDSVTYPTLVMIINLYLILLIAALITGVILSNSMLRPIKAIREKMESFTISPSRGKHIPYDNSKDEIGVLVKSYNDMVDALQESTRQLAQNERELAWKDMARQIAHDIKNPLTPMRLSIQHLIRLKQQGVEGWEGKVETIGKSLIEQIDTLSDTASQFSTIAAAASATPVEVDLDALVREQLEIFDNRDDITLVYDCKDERPIITASRKQMARVIVNLLTNAIQAIENGRGSGNIRITISRDSGSDGEFIKMDFEDDGPGVKADNMEKLFTPNFTTKSSGHGLGLAICRSIVEQAGGTIGYSASATLGGACFTMLFPA